MKKALRRNTLHPVTFGRVCTYIFIIALAAFTSLPLVYMLVTAFKPLPELLRYPPQFFVRDPTMKNFSDLLTSMDSQVVPFTRYVFNSLLTTVVAMVGSIVVCSMGAYIVSCVRPKGSALISRIVVLALMFSMPAAQIPIYMSIASLGMLNTYWALILPNIAVPMYFFLFNQFIAQVPTPIIEAARIDGAGVFKSYRSIVLPLIKPAVATVCVFSFVANWNNTSTSLLYITNDAMKTLPFAMSSIASGGLGRAGAAASAALLTTIPTILLYVLAQSKVMSTMSFAGIKG